MITNKGLSAVKGFKFSGIALKGSKKNLGLVYSSVKDTYGTAVYTRSDIKAAPVLISQIMDSETNRKRAVLINSGIANAFTGKRGLIDADNCISALSKRLLINKNECYIGSTGVIGKKLEVDSIVSGIDRLVSRLNEDEDTNFARAIITTDTKIKQASIKCDIKGYCVNIAACVKGAGMIMPNMATMLCVVITDASISHDLMHTSLRRAVEETFNCITVDGDTSTNDTIFFLANGLAGNRTIKSKSSNSYRIFYKNLCLLLEHMAKEVVNDGEGITKFITINVINTPTREKAKSVALSIANSPLVKTAFYGEDLNWGRILMAIGKSMTGMNCEMIDISINNYKIVKKGEPEIGTEDYLNAQASLKKREINLLINFNLGKESIRVWTCDMSLDYVKINAHYTT